MNVGLHTIPDYYSPIWTDMSSKFQVHVIHLYRNMIKKSQSVLQAPLSLLSSSLALSHSSFPPSSPASIPSLLSSSPPPFPSPSLPLSLSPALPPLRRFYPFPPSPTPSLRPSLPPLGASKPAGLAGKSDVLAGPETATETQYFQEKQQFLPFLELLSFSFGSDLRSARRSSSSS